MDIGKRIKERRKELGMSVDDLANHLGKNRATVYRYENGDIENLPIDVLEPLAVALDTTPQYLMGWYDTTEMANSSKHIQKQVTRWNETFTPGFFTEEEFDKLFEYAKFIVSQRKQEDKE